MDEEIKDIINERNIEWLFHFTRAENLKSILKDGLIPRNEIDEELAIVNDDCRYDKCKGANCLSVEFPNYKMFWSLRCENKDVDWVVLALDAKIIEEYKCAFCYANAGSEEIYSIPLQNRMTAEAFEGIFSERECYPSRKELNIPDNYPTNPQAEVLVFGVIPSRFIKYVIFNDEETLEKYKSIIPLGIKAIVDEDFFYPRKDYIYWQKI